MTRHQADRQMQHLRCRAPGASPQSRHQLENPGAAEWDLLEKSVWVYGTVSSRYSFHMF